MIFQHVFYTKCQALNAKNVLSHREREKKSAGINIVSLESQGHDHFSKFVEYCAGNRPILFAIFTRISTLRCRMIRRKRISGLSQNVGCDPSEKKNKRK